MKKRLCLCSVLYICFNKVQEGKSPHKRHHFVVSPLFLVPSLPDTKLEIDRHGMTNLWSVDNVCSWLKVNGLEAFTTTFIENEIDGATLLGLSERMCERIFPKIKDQVRFMAILSTLKEKENEFVPHDEPDVPAKPTTGSFQLRFPQFLINSLNNKDPDLKSHQRNKAKNALVQALYDTLSLQTMYPTHIQYVDLMRMLLMQYPFLREKCGSGYGALLESLRNKFKKERIPLISNSEVAKMRKKFSLPNGGRKPRAGSEGSESSVKKVRVALEMHDGEDEHSIQHHKEAMKVEALKQRPNYNLIINGMVKTQKYRANFIQEHSTAAVLEEFPCLRHPLLILEEMKLVSEVDVDKQVVVNLAKMSKNILDKAPKSALKDKCLVVLDASDTEEERRGQIVNTAVLLLPSVFKEDPQQLFVIDKEPVFPTPTIVLTNCKNGNPLQSSAITVKMDDTEILLDDGSVDISLALAVAFFTLSYLPS
ncbi:sterile alpha motif domain-containing protein 3-like isoform X2 [Melanotaenia boesemani]|uniref:sterile alpha motif domain-containing protein 3-like isoform X2 n=1 Tax=Melanotaenia boesemani TaxID=1250792 RepID=UPI001C059F5D|nr:sterile alpha motif domain-containing protein 3-like isoform X2 [Melanotaenia boesemani]